MLQRSVSGSQVAVSGSGLASLRQRVAGRVQSESDVVSKLHHFASLDFCHPLPATCYLLFTVKKCGHQLESAFEEWPAGREGRGFVVGMARTRQAGSRHGPGDPGSVVGLGPDEGRVVGRDQDPAALLGDGSAERADNLAVNPLERLDLGVGSPFVAGLVGGLDVNADDVVILESLDAITPLGRVIGVEVARRARDIDPIPAGEDAHASNQVDGGNDGPSEAVNLLEPGQARGFPLAPEPDGVGWGFAASQAVEVHRVIANDLGPGGARTSGQVIGGGLVGLVVRGGGQRIVGERGGSTDPSINQEVPVADSGKELDLRPTESGLESINQSPGFIRRDMSGGEVAQTAVADGHQVATNRPVIRAEGDARRGGFERSTTGEDSFGVIAEKAQGRDVAAWQESVGDVP